MHEQKNSTSRETRIAQTFRLERKRVLDFIRRRVRMEADAEDILQDVFYQLLTGYNIAEPIEKLTPWLFTVARNKIIDWYRKRKAESLPANFDDSSGRTTG
ncbi:MAG TPA: sigma-70 family RNA polymerase sigma factor [bacterium]